MEFLLIYTSLTETSPQNGNVTPHPNVTIVMVSIKKQCILIGKVEAQSQRMHNTLTESDISRKTVSHEIIGALWKKHSMLHIFHPTSMPFGAPHIQRKLCSNHPALHGCHAL